MRSIGLHQRRHGQGLQLLDKTGGTSGTFKFQAGVLASETIDVKIADMQSATLGVNSLAVSDATKANECDNSSRYSDKESIDRKSKSRGFLQSFRKYHQQY